MFDPFCGDQLDLMRSMATSRQGAIRQEFAIFSTDLTAISGRFFPEKLKLK